MARGDQIYVLRPFVGVDGVYEHHGIDCGDGTVIHYSKVTAPPTVQRTSWEQFSWGRPVHTSVPPVSYIPDVVIERAERRLGEQQYNLLNNNCEHFATWCKTGRSESKQLATFGLDVTQISSEAARALIGDAVHGSDVVKADALRHQALQNVAIARRSLLPSYEQAHQEMETWHRVAELALQQGKEAAARAALERKVKAKRTAENLWKQLSELSEIEASLQRNTPGLTPV